MLNMFSRLPTLWSQIFFYFKSIDEIYLVHILVLCYFSDDCTQTLIFGNLSSSKDPTLSFISFFTSFLLDFDGYLKKTNIHTNELLKLIV